MFEITMLLHKKNPISEWSKLQKETKTKSAVKRNNSSTINNGINNWNDESNTLQRNLLDDKTILTYFNINIKNSRRDDIAFIDSLLSENRLRREPMKRIVVGNNKICFVPVFIRNETEESSHWLLIVIDKSFVLTQIYVIDSFECYFKHKQNQQSQQS